MDDYKIGDEVIITGYPGVWSSLAGGKWPRDAKYPIIGSIFDRKMNSICVLDYGFSLEDLIRKGMISHKSPEIELVEGKWYEVTTDIRWIYKYSKNGKSGNNNLTEFSKCVDLKNNFKYSNNWITDKKEIYPKLANLEEVYAHFPEEKPKESPMKEEEFKVGDRVECTKKYSSVINRGNIGTIVNFQDRGESIGIEWENITNGHSCDGYAKKTNSGYYVTKEYIKLIPSIKEESSIPEYVQCYKNLGYTNNFEVGKTYKVVKIDSNGYLHVIDKNNVILQVYRGFNHPNKDKDCCYFELSTESAFLAQNKPIPSPSIEEDWCVALDSSNKENILEWSRSIGLHGYQGTCKYYGIYNKSNIAGKFWCETYPWGKLLTTEQFYTKIGKSMPNKEITLIKDRYYSCRHENGSKFFLQFDRLIDDYLYVKAHRQDREKWNEYSCTWIYSKNSQFKEVTESEAKGIIAPVKEENLVGRWAKVISNWEFGYLGQDNLRCNSKFFYTIGKIGKIVKDDEKWSDKVTKWVQFEGCNNGITLNQLELMPLGWSLEAKSIDSMSKEELLEEAKRRFPNNSHIKCILNENSGTINWDNMSGYRFESPYWSGGNKEIWLGIEEQKGNKRICIFRNNQWAKIVSSSQHSPLFTGTAGEIPHNQLYKTIYDPYEKSVNSSILIDTEVVDIKIPKKSASVTLKNTENEVKVVVKSLKTIKIN